MNFSENDISTITFQGIIHSYNDFDRFYKVFTFMYFNDIQYGPLSVYNILS